MGGVGSGRRWGWNAKDTTGSYRCITITHITRDVQRQGRQLTAEATLRYRWNTIHGEEITGPLALDSTRCHFGGLRFWFRCPTTRCGRRVAILYITQTGLFCRHCLSLTYRTRQQSPANRLLSKVQKIRERLGGSGNMGEAFPRKPKRMHWRTYWRLRQTAGQAWDTSLDAVMGSFSGAGERR